MLQIIDDYRLYHLVISHSYGKRPIEIDDKHYDLPFLKIVISIDFPIF